MRLLIWVMLLISVICMSSSAEQQSHQTGKVVVIGNLAAEKIKNVTNATNVTILTDISYLKNVTGQMNVTNETHSNISRLNGSLFQPDVNESRMETPSQAISQSNSQLPLSRYDWSSLGKDSDKHEGYLVP
jgi:hypothetical protein